MPSIANLKCVPLVLLPRVHPLSPLKGATGHDGRGTWSFHRPSDTWYPKLWEGSSTTSATFPSLQVSGGVIWVLYSIITCKLYNWIWHYESYHEGWGGGINGRVQGTIQPKVNSDARLPRYDKDITRWRGGLCICLKPLCHQPYAVENGGNLRSQLQMAWTTIEQWSC